MTPLILAALVSLPSPANLRCAALAPASVLAAEAHAVPSRLVLALAYRETRCKPWVVGGVGEVGAWQVRPEYAHTSGDAHDGARMFARWMKRARRDVVKATRAYNAGQCGLRGKCGNEYARAVLATAGGLR